MVHCMIVLIACFFASWLLSVTGSLSSLTYWQICRAQLFKISRSILMNRVGMKGTFFISHSKVEKDPLSLVFFLTFFYSGIGCKWNIFLADVPLLFISNGTCIVKMKVSDTIRLNGSDWRLFIVFAVLFTTMYCH